MALGRHTLSIETGKMAKQADGAVVVRVGDTVVLATACAQKEPKAGIDFMPLTVDYREGNYAGGKIPGGFFKREGRPNEKEVLTSRMIDRPLRPLFPEGYACETQVIGLLLSADLENDSDTLAIIGASTALYISDIPFDRPVGAVRVGYWDGACVVNPATADLKAKSQLNLLVAGTEHAIVMVEAAANEVSEAVMTQALVEGHAVIKQIVAIQKDLRARVGEAQAAPRQEGDRPGRGGDDRGRAHRAAARGGAPQGQDRVLRPDEEGQGRIRGLAHRGAGRDQGRGFRRLRRPAREALEARDLRAGTAPRRPALRRGARDHERGGRAAAHPRLGALHPRRDAGARHGRRSGPPRTRRSSTPCRKPSTRKRFMLHYNFPPFSVGEVKFLRGPGRREIGHGALAERSLREMLPPEEAFPYTIRVVSDILESNGSSSMASVCGGTLAMMDAGVPIKNPVAGVAMGLVMDGDRHQVLTDIAGEEDHYGDMDFKVAGTRTGITALQMDIKVDGLAPALMAGALEQARVGRIHILDRMLEALAQPRTEISPYAPRILTIRVPVDKIRDIIGPGGKMIRSIVERTGCKIDIEDDGRVAIASVDESAARKAIAIIEELTATPELNKSYLGKVVRVVEFGAFVEILPGTDGLLHVSEMAHHRVNNVHDEVKEGDQVLVKVVSIDPSGKIRLSRKALLEEAQGGTPAAVAAGGGEGSGGPSHGDRPHGGHDRGHGGGGRDRDRRPGGGGGGRDRRPGGGGGGRDRH